MLIPNPRAETLQEILPLIQQKFPLASMKKMWLSQECIVIPQVNYKFLLTMKRNGFKVNHTLPPGFLVIGVAFNAILISAFVSVVLGYAILGGGGAMLTLAGMWLLKLAFEWTKKQEFKTFRSELNRTISNAHFERALHPQPTT